MCRWRGGQYLLGPTVYSVAGSGAFGAILDLLLESSPSASVYLSSSDQP
jgi:hypothetical protein